MLGRLKKRLTRTEQQKVEQLEKKAATKLAREAELIKVKKRRVEVQRALAKTERQLADLKKKELLEAVSF